MEGDDPGATAVPDTPPTPHPVEGIDSSDIKESPADPEVDDKGFTLVERKKPKTTRNPDDVTDERPKNKQRDPIAPRQKYIRLAFPEETSTAEKIRWMREVSRLPSLQEHGPLDMVQGKWRSSRYVYVRRDQQRYVDLMTNGAVAGISLEDKDEYQPRPKKYGEYLVTRFPKEAPADDAMHLPGVFKARRIYKEGQPLNRIIIVWSGERPPPSEHHFFGKYIEPSSIRPWGSDVVACYKCQGYGHVAKHCRKESACAVCAEAHQTKDCPARNRRENSDNEDAVTIVKRCIRCGEQGVTAWHRNCPHKPARLQPPPAPTVPTDRGVATASPSTPRPVPCDVTNPQEFPQLPGGAPIPESSATELKNGDKIKEMAEEIGSLRQEIAELKKLLMGKKSDSVNRKIILPNDVSDIDNVNVVNEIAHASADITHDIINESSGNGGDIENNVEDIGDNNEINVEDIDDNENKVEDMQEMEDLLENTRQMMASSNYRYSVNLRKMRDTFENRQEALDICNAINDICKLKGFIKQRLNH